MNKIMTKNGYKYNLTKQECEDLLSHEKAALNNTYPIANDGYAVACMTDRGNIYTGVSYKSDTATLTMHSEMTALSYAAIHGEKNIAAITGPNCHVCKQLLYENGLNSGIDIMVVMSNQGKIEQVPMSEMMPYPWSSRSRTK